MFFLRGRRRKKLLQLPLDPDQRRLLHEAAPLCAALPNDLHDRHEGIVRVLLAEKTFETAGDLELTDSIRLAIAGQAALLQLRDGAEFYPGLDTILIYPDAFVVEHEEWDEDGLVHAGPDERAGESWQRGVVVLSWADAARESRRRDGYNVVLHEFAHQLDELVGDADGTPPLPADDRLAAWPEIFQTAFEQHQRALRRRRPILFDDDAADSPAEFFATAVELFFEHPSDLRAHFTGVYEMLSAYLELDPTSWSG